jgi:hypothetical protein
MVSRHASQDWLKSAVCAICVRTTRGSSRRCGSEGRQRVLNSPDSSCRASYGSRDTKPFLLRSSEYPRGHSDRPSQPVLGCMPEITPYPTEFRPCQLKFTYGRVPCGMCKSPVNLPSFSSYATQAAYFALLATGSAIYGTRSTPTSSSNLDIMSPAQPIQPRACFSNP